MLGWLFKTRPAEAPMERWASASGFTMEIMRAREAYISGRGGLAELTATAQTCVSFWEGALSLADVEGAPNARPADNGANGALAGAPG